MQNITKETTKRDNHIYVVHLIHEATSTKFSGHVIFNQTKLHSEATLLPCFLWNPIEHF